MSKETKTIGEWIDLLPDGYREMAKANANVSSITVPAEDMADAIGRAFEWSKTPEGHQFWKCLRDHYSEGTPLPSLLVPDDVFGPIEAKPLLDEIREAVQEYWDVNEYPINWIKVDKAAWEDLSSLSANEVFFCEFGCRAIVLSTYFKDRKFKFEII